MVLKRPEIELASNLDRRRVLMGASAMGLSSLLTTLPAMAQAVPKKGGTLRLGMTGGSASDSMDPRTYGDRIAIAYSLLFFNQLVEIDESGNAGPELAESWESKAGASEWIFNIRKGISFGSGKTLDADDVIYSLNLHRGETKSPAKSALEPISDIKKLSPNQIQITLKAGNADLPYALTDYHIVIVPNGTTDFSKADGTGAYTLTEWQPGNQLIAKKKPGNYWKPNRGNFDAVHIRYITDASIRTQALISGQVDAINGVDPKTVNFLAANKNIKITRTKGAGERYAFVAHVDADPYKNQNVMLGLKYGIDRQKIIDNVFSGFATAGNDQTLGPTSPFFNAALPAKPYDPDKSKFYFKKAGMSGPFELQVSDGAFNGAVDAGVVFQESLKPAGAQMNLKRVSGDGYWDNVWLKAPFCAVVWGNRATADLQLSATFLSTSPVNDTRFKNENVDKLLAAARVELNHKKRKEFYHEAQKVISEEAGMICFAASDQMSASNVRLQGLNPHPRYDLNDLRIGEKGWFA